MRDNNTTIVISHYNEDLGWTDRLKEQFTDIRIYTKENPNSKYNVPINKGNEASAYLLYIIENYDNLKDYTIFLHGHEYSCHHNGSLVDLIFQLKDTKTFYLNINNYKLGYILQNWAINDLKIWYDSYLKEECGDIESYGDWTYGHIGCAQFIVHKSTIRTKTKKFYENLFNWITTTEIPSSTSGRFLEWTWHLIWNQVPKIENSQPLVSEGSGEYRGPEGIWRG